MYGRFHIPSIFYNCALSYKALGTEDTIVLRSGLRRDRNRHPASMEARHASLTTSFDLRSFSVREYADGLTL